MSAPADLSHLEKLAGLIRHYIVTATTWPVPATPRRRCRPWSS
jgi:hypothetical protein